MQCVVIGGAVDQDQAGLEMTISVIPLSRCPRRHGGALAVLHHSPEAPQRIDQLHSTCDAVTKLRGVDQAGVLGRYRSRCWC